MATEHLTLGIETSCDETAAAVVRGAFTPISSVVASQEEIHGRYGGVVPELACRRHAEVVAPVVDEALKRAGVGLESIDLVAVTRGPGLVGALLVGLSYAKGLAFARSLPLVGVNHLEGHVMAAFVAKPDLPLPSLALLVSGGHTELFLVENLGQLQRLGGTRDDAAGEAFDKVAKMLGLGYPGGPLVEKAARGHEPRFPVPIGLDRIDSIEFSFSGTKTAVKRIAQAHPEPGRPVGSICASFQEGVVKALVKKTRIAARQYKPRSLSVVGGVACNGPLRKKIKDLGDELGIQVAIPEPSLCADNAVMIAAAGAVRYKATPDNPVWRMYHDLDADPGWLP